MSDKGNVYVCGWKRNIDGTHVGWFKRRPSIRIQADDKEELGTELVEAIGEYFDDQEAAIEFDPPMLPSKTAQRFLTKEFVSFAWNDSVWVEEPSEQYFTGGFCPACKWARGTRTDVPLKLRTCPRDSDGAFTVFGQSHLHAHVQVIHERIAEKFAPSDLRQFMLRPVIMPLGRHAKFFEIIPHRFAPDPAIRGRRIHGWRCSKCDYRIFSHPEFRYDIDAVRRFDLPRAGKDWFFIGGPTRYTHCLRTSRFQKLFGKDRPRKLVKNMIAAIDDDRCILEPKLHNLAGIMARAARGIHGYRSRAARQR